jgi:hypothetical protein
MANAAVQPEVSAGLGTSIRHSLFSATHKLRWRSNQNMMPLVRIADYHDG